jgi:hypothetical protein
MSFNTLTALSISHPYTKYSMPSKNISVIFPSLHSITNLYAQIKAGMACAMRSFENVNEDNVEEWLKSDVCELGFQYMTDTDTVNAATKQKGEDEGGDDDSKKRRRK